MTPVLLPILIVVLVVVLIVWSARRSRNMLETWAYENGYQVEHAQWRWIRKGPYFWKSSKNQHVYYFIATDEDGRQRTGWARCGGFWLGLLTSEIDVTWDDER